jgi:hypothetical protein
MSTISPGTITSWSEGWTAMVLMMSAAIRKSSPSRMLPPKTVRTTRRATAGHRAFLAPPGQSACACSAPPAKEPADNRYKPLLEVSISNSSIAGGP